MVRDEYSSGRGVPSECEVIVSGYRRFAGRVGLLQRRQVQMLSRHCQHVWAAKKYPLDEENRLDVA